MYALTVMLFLCLLSKYMTRYDNIFKDNDKIEVLDDDQSEDKTVFQSCVDFRQHYVDKILFNFSYTAVLLLCLMTMLYKLNITSIIVGVNFIALYRARFYPNRYSREILQKREKAAW